MENHINTFEKGMNKDYNVLYQPEGTYRNCINCQLISQDGNNYTITDCLGNTRVFRINIPFLSFTRGTPPTVTYQNAPMPIGFISFPDKLIVFSTNDESEIGGYGEIGIIRYTTYGEGIQPLNNDDPSYLNTYKGYLPLYHHTSLNFTKLRQIEGFAFEENDSIQRVYWTDNLNEPRVFNVADPIFQDYMVTGSLIVGEQYMVIEGAITHNGLIYSPDYTTDVTPPIAPNVFTAVNANFIDESASFVVAKVVKYVPYQLLNFTPSRSMGNIKFSSYGTGTVYCGAKMYFYRLTRPSDGIATSWSYGSYPIQVGTLNSVTGLVGTDYFSFSGGGTTTVLRNSTKSVKITIDNIDTNFTNIEVAVAEFDQILDTPRLISVISNDLISAVTITPPASNATVTVEIEHTGGVNIETLTLDQITLFPASILTCKTMSTNKNYALIGNIKEREEFADFDKSTVVATQIDYPMPCHYADFAGLGSAVTCDNILSYTNIGPVTNANPPTTDGIKPHTRWLVVSGIATYNGTAYGPAQVAGQVFTGVVGAFNWTNTSSAVVRPCTYKNKYTTSGGDLVPNIIQLTERYNNTAYWNYKDPAVESHVKGYWNGETYRFGILFYDLKGNPFYVRHLTDFVFDNQDAIPMLNSIQVESSGQEAWYTHQTGLSLDGISIPSSIIDKISGFSIVRVERDATIMSQGMAMQVGGLGVTVHPLCSPTPSENYFGYSGSENELIALVCPDNLVSYPIQNYAPGSYLEPAVWFAPLNYAGLALKSSYDAPETFEAKYFTQLPAETTGPANRNYPIVSLSDVDENVTITGFGSGNWTYINTTKFNVAGAPITPADGTCSGSPNPDMRESEAIGGKRTLMEFQDPIFYDYNSTTSMYTDLAVTNIYKAITNVRVTKSSLYGGSSEAALANSLYISTGHFQEISATVKADTYDAGTDSYIFNEVEIWGGDAYTCIIDYGHSLQDVTLAPAAPAFDTHAWGIKFPCQCNSNYDLRRGRTTGTNRMNSGGTGVCYNPARLESFEYNKGYSSDGNFIKYPALPVNFISSGVFKFRIRYAGQKFPGEILNSFRTFAVNDYKDTDGQGGEINNLRTKSGQSIVWQNRIISTVSILERIINTSANGDPTTLGTGGVVDRFDPVNDYFGNQHQKGLVETEYGFAWFDMRRKAFVTLDLRSGVIEVSKVDGMKSYFDEVIIDNIGDTSSFTTQPIGVNSVTFNEKSDRPLVGVGITGVYDPKLKMTYLTFKWKNYPVPGNLTQFINKGFTIGYYHPGQMFIGFYDWLPAISWNHNQIVISVNNPKNKTKYYGPGMSSTDFVVGETVPVDSREYVCIKDVTVASYPGTSGVNGSDPTEGTNNWTLINTTNELFVHNQPSALSQTIAPDYIRNKFFNLVVDNEIEFVVNPKVPNPFSVLAIEQKGNDANYTDIYIDADGITASDNDISSTNRFYRFIYDKITSNLPLSLTGRITNSYLKVRMVKKNWTTNPTTLVKSPKLLQWARSFFEQKR